MRATEVRPGLVLPDASFPPVTRAALARFAAAAGDPNPVHTDPRAARDAGFPDVIAHGMLSMAHLSRAVRAWFPGARLARLAVRFESVTPLYAVPRARAEVVDVDATAEGVRAVLTVEVLLRDDTITMTGSATVVLGHDDWASIRP